MSEDQISVDLSALYCEQKSDSEYPAASSMLPFEVGGSRIFGTLYIPHGPGPHPVMLMLHGLPGAVRNEDIAQTLRRTGMAAFIFSWRGAWGSEGTWSYDHCYHDSLAAFDLLRNPDTAARYRLDPERVLVMGHSLGGLMAMLVARDRPVRDVVLLSPADASKQWKEAMATPEGREKRIKRLTMLCEPLGGTCGEQVWTETAEQLENFDLMACVPHLQDKRFFMAGAQHDTLLPLERYFDPVVEALEARMPGCVSTCLLPTGHNYNSHRMELSAAIVQWLVAQGY